MYCFRRKSGFYDAGISCDQNEIGGVRKISFWSGVRMCCGKKLVNGRRMFSSGLAILIAVLNKVSRGGDDGHGPLSLFGLGKEIVMGLLIYSVLFVVGRGDYHCRNGAYL